MESIFIGVILTATSVSITVEALQDMGTFKKEESEQQSLGQRSLMISLGIVFIINYDKPWGSIWIPYSGNP